MVILRGADAPRRAPGRNAPPGRPRGRAATASGPRGAGRAARRPRSEGRSSAGSVRRERAGAVRPRAHRPEPRLVRPAAVGVGRGARRPLASGGALDRPRRAGAGRAREPRPRVPGPRPRAALGRRGARGAAARSRPASPSTRTSRPSGRGPRPSRPSGPRGGADLPDLRWALARGAGRLLEIADGVRGRREDALHHELLLGAHPAHGGAALQRPRRGGAGRGARLPVAAVDGGRPEAFFREVVRAGYRAPFLLALARDVASGALDLEVLRARTSRPRSCSGACASSSDSGRTPRSTCSASSATTTTSRSTPGRAGSSARLAAAAPAAVGPDAPPLVRALRRVGGARDVARGDGGLARPGAHLAVMAGPRPW